MKIAYVTEYDANDLFNWSGTGYYIWKSLGDFGIQIELVGPLKLPYLSGHIINSKRVIYRRISNKSYFGYHDAYTSKKLSYCAWEKISNLKNIDAIVSPGPVPVAYLPGTIPLVVINDATHKALFKTYPLFKNICKSNIRDGDIIERSAIKRASAMIFSSQWAAESALNDYQADPKKIHVVPFGANFTNPPSREIVINSINQRNNEIIKLIFIGVDWERKGGPLVISILRDLHSKGFQAQLTIVGCSPEISPSDSHHVHVLGKISKTENGQSEICRLLMQSHFLVVPSEAECYGLVYCEASMCGVPSLGRNVGGVSTIIHNGINGNLFSPNQSSNEYSDWIIENIDKKKYNNLAVLSRNEYENRLNWKVSALKIKQVIDNIVS